MRRRETFDLQTAELHRGIGFQLVFDPSQAGSLHLSPSVKLTNTQRCYYLSRHELVVDMLALINRNDPVITRTPAEIRAEKERLEKASERAKKAANRSATRRKQ